MESLVPLLVAVPLGVAFLVVILAHIRSLRRAVSTVAVLAVAANLVIALVLLPTKLQPIFVGGWGPGPLKTLGIELVCSRSCSPGRTCGGSRRSGCSRPSSC